LGIPFLGGGRCELGGKAFLVLSKRGLVLRLETRQAFLGWKSKGGNRIASPPMKTREGTGEENTSHAGYAINESGFPHMGNKADQERQYLDYSLQERGDSARKRTKPTQTGKGKPATNITHPSAV